jgi:hypothetical protein
VERTRDQSIDWRIVMAFLVIAIVSAIPRFGERENEALSTVSDSDLYLDMARVFVGDSPRFDQELLEIGPHHYNRPLLPFLAGWLARASLHGNVRAAFSTIAILASTLVALLMFRMVQRLRLADPPWLPSVLFLCGFPQMNWGYHILTDTLGIATAFVSFCLAADLIRQADDVAAAGRVGWTSRLFVLWLVSSIAFLTRETAWIAVVGASVLAFTKRPATRQTLAATLLVVVVASLGKLPHSAYANHFGTSGVPLVLSASVLVDHRYLADFFVKTAVCFNFAWLLALVAARRRTRIPPEVIGWSVGAACYVAAGYAANSIEGIGYPMRMSYSLFPLVFVLAASALAIPSFAGRRRTVVVIYCLLQFTINLTGVFLDPSRGRIRVTDLMSAIDPHVAWWPRL